MRCVVAVITRHPELGKFPIELQKWYRAENTTASSLTVRERCLRYESLALRELLERLNG